MSFSTFSYAGSESPTKSLTDFTHTFVLNNTRGVTEALSEVPKALVADISRKRRAHKKSGKGCENCRRRRVKCNERHPCETCIRRREICKAFPWESGGHTPSSTLSQPLQSLVSDDAVVNLQHMKLFHHFESSTIHTLLMNPVIWRETLQLSFQVEFLMNTILCVAARHLSVLEPDNSGHSATAARHLARALSLFQHQLSTDFESIHIDAFIANTLLLLYQVWAQPDPLTLNNNPSKDSIFAISSALKETFLTSVPRIYQPSPSIFLPSLQHPPMKRLAAVAQISRDSLARFQEFFSFHRPLESDMLDSLPSFKRSTSDIAPDPWNHYSNGGSIDLVEGSYVSAVGRLCLILAFLPGSGVPQLVSDGLLSDLARCIIMFPVSCHGEFASMVRRGDSHALLLLYHFYRATRILLCSTEYWWANRHASRREKVIHEHLASVISVLK